MFRDFDLKKSEKKILKKSEFFFLKISSDRIDEQIIIVTWSLFKTSTYIFNSTDTVWVFDQKALRMQSTFNI